MSKTSFEIVADGELLTKAAKAYGINGFFTAAVGGFLVTDTKVPRPNGKGNAVNGCYSGWVWNPLEDDGDALRLAAKLHLSIDFAEWTHTVFYGVDKFVKEDWHNGDTYSAVRRAIVRAAVSYYDLLNV